MTLTLAVIAGLLLLLPGMTAVAVWNLTNKASASRPELPLTAVSVLFVTLLVALGVHLFAYLLVTPLIQALEALGNELPPFQGGHALTDFLYSAKGTLLPAPANPFDLIVRAARGERLGGDAFAEIAATIGVECLMVGALIGHEGLSVAFDGIDLANRGWAFTHILRPIANGYAPVAYVLTTVMKDGLGVGYKGPVGDLRLSERGEVVTLSLDRPERFLFEMRAGSDGGGYGGEPRGPSWKRHTDEYLGGVVALDGKNISNIVVTCPRPELVDEIGKLASDLTPDDDRRPGS
jgi:hypothetical protein